jgi:hypothetical protein
LLSGIHEDELELFNLESFDDLVNAGVSEDDLRIFDTQWYGARVAGWTTRPLFLTADPALIARWADLRTELAAAQTNSVIFYEQNIVKVVFGLTCESSACSSCTSPERGDPTAVASTGRKPIVALVRPSVSPPSIRWRSASLILYAHCAGISFREHAPSQESVTSVTRAPHGHVHFRPPLHPVSSLS